MWNAAAQGSCRQHARSAREREGEKGGRGERERENEHGLATARKAMGCSCPSPLGLVSCYHLLQMLDTRLQDWLFVLLGSGLALGWSLLFSYSFLLEQKCLSCAYLTFISWKYKTYFSISYRASQLSLPPI